MTSARHWQGFSNEPCDQHIEAARAEMLSDSVSMGPISNCGSCDWLLGSCCCGVSSLEAGGVGRAWGVPMLDRAIAPGLL